MLRALLLGFALSGAAAAADLVAVPALTGHVVDLTATLSAPQAQALEQRLAELERAKGSQLAVLIVPTTGAQAIEQYSIRVAEQWKLGRARVDDGAILLVAMKDRAVRIEVGYGLEGALNDAVCKRIIAESIEPAFRQGDYYGGIAAALERMAAAVRGEPLPEPAAGASPAQRPWNFGALLVFTVIAGAVLRALLGRLPGALAAGGLVGLVVWWVAGALSIALGAALFAFVLTLAGSLGGFLPGGFGGGSGGNGGFRGGGGRFGGGGASGRW